MENISKNILYEMNEYDFGWRLNELNDMNRRYYFFLLELKWNENVIQIPIKMNLEIEFGVLLIFYFHFYFLKFFSSKTTKRKKEKNLKRKTFGNNTNVEYENGKF